MNIGVIQMGARIHEEAGHPELGIEAERVLNYILQRVSAVDPNGYLLISQTSVASELGIKQPSVNRALIRLIVGKYIRPLPLRCGLYKAYRLAEQKEHRNDKARLLNPFILENSDEVDSKEPQTV